MEKTNEITVRGQQSIEDLALQYYGTPEGVLQLMIDNRDQLTKGFDSRLHAGMKLRVRDTATNQELKDAMSRLLIVPATDKNTGIFVPDGPDFNEDYNEDFDSIEETNE